MKIINKIGNLFFIDNKDKQFFIERNLGFDSGMGYQLDIYEVLYILDKFDFKIKENSKFLSVDNLICNINYLNYVVFKDLKSKGYNVKSGMKYGFPFRVYNKGIKEGEDHSLWLVLPLKFDNSISVDNIISKARVSHSVKKRILFAFVDNENNILYYELSWKRI